MFLSATTIDTKNERMKRILAAVLIAGRWFEIGWVKYAKKKSSRSNL